MPLCFILNYNKLVSVKSGEIQCDLTPDQRTLRLASYAANNSTSFGVM
jgi:hypothetical protein